MAGVTQMTHCQMGKHGKAQPHTGNQADPSPELTPSDLELGALPSAVGPLLVLTVTTVQHPYPTSQTETRAREKELS